MYVCICNAVSERKIHQAAAEGARTLDELQEALGVATGCGTCAEFARDCLQEALDQQRADAPDMMPGFQPA
jgi:bacterioferritin-associated ferredoxin